MGISKNIKRIREIYGLTQQDLADIAGVTNKAVSAWESGAKEPRMGAIEKIAQRFNILKSNIIEENGMENLHLNEFRLPVNAERIRGASVTAKLYGSIAAGIPLEMIPVEDQIEIPQNMANRYPDAFLLRVTGDSMNKVVPNGAYALIDPAEDAKNGEVVAVTVNGHDATLKRFYKMQNSIALEPDSYNQDHATKLYGSNNEDDEAVLKIIGRMVWFMSPFDAKF